jgi:hypothetical protein
VAAVVHPAAVGGAAHLRGHLVEREVERRHLVLGAASARITGPLENAVSSTRTARSVLTGVAFLLHLDLHPDDPVIVLLQPGSFSST